MKTAYEFRKLILMDDATLHGGTSHSNETLEEFMIEINRSIHTPIEEVNKWLVECGIQPIKEQKDNFLSKEE